MNAEDPGETGTSPLAWVAIAVLVTAIVLLAAVARGPEDQDRAGAPDTRSIASVRMVGA